MPVGEKRHKRPNQVTMDLQGYKSAWLAWCLSRELKPSEAFRQIVARLTAQRKAGDGCDSAHLVERNAPERATCWKKISLTPSELKHVLALAEAEGFSATKWLAALVRARLTSTPQLGQQELEVLARETVVLLSVARNLNQIARALNTNPTAKEVVQIESIQALAQEIKKHVVMVSDVMSASIHRWRIK